MQKLDVMIGRLRLLLAEVTAKESQSAALRKQLQEQLDRVVSYTLYGESELDRNLALMSDVQQRIDTLETTVRHLGLVRNRAERELESLLLTRGVEHAKTQLADLLERKAAVERALADVAAVGGAIVDLEQASTLRQTDDALAAQIRQLQHDINEASERAARTLETPRR